MLIDSIKNLPLTSITRLPDGRWRFRWNDNGAGSWRVVEAGRVVSVVSSSLYESINYDLSPPSVEINDAAKQCLSEAHLPRLRLQWYRVNAISHYKVQRRDGSVWTTEAVVPATAEPFRTYFTPDLTPGQEHTYRVIAVNETGGESDPLEFTRFVESPPAPPEVDVTYATGQITVAGVP